MTHSLLDWSNCPHGLIDVIGWYDLHDPTPRTPKPLAPGADATAMLTASQRGAVGNSIRRCWPANNEFRGTDMQVLITVTVDGANVIRRADVASEDVSRVVADPPLRAFAYHAVRAVMDPECSSLPLPPALFGQTQQFTLCFRS